MRVVDKKYCTGLYNWAPLLNLEVTVKFLAILLLVFLPVGLFAQSAETGSPFNQYMSADAGVNLLSGTVSISKNLASLSVGDVQASFAMSYSGNVTQYVNNRNDVAPTGWLGLGWAMGFAKIVCDHNGSMFLDDDSYYLMTAEGNKHKIFKDEKGSWWITNLPYWKIKPTIRKNVNYGGHTYDIIVGWMVTDDSGKKYYYGDFDSLNDLQNGKYKRNATQYVLCWPNTYGMVGQAIGGTPRLYPNVWNLQKMEDLKKNYLTYTYVQKKESLYTNGQKSSAQYTKECYLQSVQSSEGEKVEFELKKKGEGVFKDEYLDMVGSKEVDENDADSYVDPIERYYLDKVKFYGKNGALVRQVEFCYDALFFAPNNTAGMVYAKVQKDSRYVKRLLKTVIFSDSEGNIVDRESYEYNTDDNASGSMNNAPFGMMTAVQGFNCGRLEFNYTYVRTSSAKDSDLHKQEIPLTKVSSIGYLEDGTPYIVGFNSSDYVTVYARIFGRWTFCKSFSNDDDMKKDDDASFVIGDKGWFIYVKPNSKGATYTPVVWNGRGFVKKTPVVDNSVRVNVAVGAGFIFKAIIEEDGSRSHITLSIPWSIWGKTYSQKDFNDNHFAAEDGAFDRAAIKVFASANHVGIFYLGTDGGNNGRLKIYTFNHDKTQLVRTYYDDDLDDDNRYALNGNVLYGGTEDRGAYGHNADVFQWKESAPGNNAAGWYNTHWNLNGVQSEPSIEAYGPDFFAIKHNDGDDMSLFYWNGEKWLSKYKNRNMVSGDDFDFWYEAEWDGYSGNNFFIAREPLVVPKTISIPYWVPKRWGLRKRHLKIEVWSSTHRGALLDRYDFRDGVWSNSGAQNLDGSRKKTHLMLGTDWYIEKTSKKALTWDGIKWKTEPIDVDFGDDSKSIGGNSFVVEKNKKSTIYFKKSDSFTAGYGFYVVTGKVIKDPVLDKIVTYTYQYNSNPSLNYDASFLNTSSDVTFDFVNNSPIISSYTIVLPNNLGYETKELCNSTLWNVDEFGLGAGQVCKEVTMNAIGIATNVKTTEYERFHGDNKWPAAIYQDRASKVVTENNKSRTEIRYSYSAVNGQISSVKTFLDGNTTPEKEKQIVYAVEIPKYKPMLDSNRLTEETETIECLGACGSNGKNVISANASTFKPIERTVNGTVNRYYVVSEVWSYKKLDKNSQFSFDHDAPPTGNANWEKVSNYSKYENYKAIESIDKLGIKSAAFYENKVTGALQGNVINAGYNESFLLPGAATDVSDEKIQHTLRFRDNNYTIVPLSCGNVVDWYNRGSSTPSQQCVTDGVNNAINYGRFASNAILVNSSYALRGKVTPEKKKKYLFSAWVQGINVSSGKAALYVNNNYSKPAKEWDLLGSGKWQPIEWEGELSSGKREFELKVNDGNSMRVQNVIFIPSEASASVTYWNKRWNKTIASVNDRGIGSYSALDNAGRVVQTFGEDNDGNIVKLSESEYHASDCRAYPDGVGTLAQLKINGDNVSGLKNGATLKYVVPDGTKKIEVKWKTTESGDRVRYAFIKKGEDVDNWTTSCCNVLEGAVLSLDDNSDMLLLIDVISNDGLYYTVEIVRSTTGWVDHGSPRSVGDMPKYASSTASNELYYLKNDGVVKANYTGNVWQESVQKIDIRPELLEVNSAAASSYVVTLPYLEKESWMEKDANGKKTIQRFNNSTANVYLATNPFSSYGNIGVAGEMMDLYRLAVDNNGVPYVLFQKNENKGETMSYEPAVDSTGKPLLDTKGDQVQKRVKVGKVESHLYVKKFDRNSNSWIMVGNTLKIDGNAEKASVVPDIVSDYGAIDADIIFGSDGVPYVAYIGRIADMKYLDENVTETIKNEKGEESEKSGTNTIVPRVVIVKRLYSSRSVDNSIDKPIWAGPSKTQDDVNSPNKLPEIWGDLVQMPVTTEDGVEEMPITTAKKVKFAKGKDGLYLAILYQLSPGAEANDMMDVSKSKYALSVFKASNKTEIVVDDDNNSLEKDAFKFEPLLDYSVDKSLYSSSIEEEKRVVAYLDDTDPFDLEIYTDPNSKIEYPHVMFANEANGNRLTVVRYNGVRWLSVGRPAFADVRNESEGADLAIASGVPYVVFKEGASSINVDRQNMVVPQKYSGGDEDLTLLSLGDVPGTTVAVNFRQYILNYAASVLAEQTSIVINPVPEKTSDVCAIVVENNDMPAAQWKSSATECSGADFLPGVTVTPSNVIPTMDIPLNSGPNDIKVKVFASTGEFLPYTISLYREIEPDDGLSVMSGDGSLQKSDEKDLPSENGCKTKEVTFSSFGSAQKRRVCFQFNAFWTMTHRNNTYYTGSCFGIDFPKTCSESNYEVIRLSDSKCNTKIIKIKDASCKQNEKKEYWTSFSSSSGYDSYSSSIDPLIYSSSSVPPYMSSSSEPPYMSSSSVPPYMSSSSVPPYMSSSSEEKCVQFKNGEGHYNEKCFNSGLENMENGKCYTMNPDRANENPVWINNDASQTWWWIETPCYEVGISSSSVFPYMSSSSVPPYMMSSSVPPYMSSSSEPPHISSSSNTNIPEEYSSLTGFKVFASGNMNIADRVVLDEGSFGCASANVGSNANVTISLYVSGDVQLRNNSYTERVVAGGNVDVQAGARYGVLLNETVVSPDLVVHNVLPGSEDLIVYNNQTVTINPGSYRRIHIYSGANVTINGGEYNLESFNVEPDVRLSFNNSGTPIRMWIRDAFYLADRVTINSNAPAENLFVYTNTNSLDLGTDLSLRAILVAPNADVNVSSRYTWNGRIWAREITIQPDVVVR